MTRRTVELPFATFRKRVSEWMGGWVSA
jgi:ribosome modulation factor